LVVQQVLDKSHLLKIGLNRARVSHYKTRSCNI